MKTFPEMIVCEHCDSVYHHRKLEHSEVARCKRCAFTLERGNRLDIASWLALAITASVLFLIANIYPVIRIGLQGMHNETTLWQAAIALARGVTAPMAVPVALFLIIVPMIQIGMLIWVLSYACFLRRAPGFVPVMRLLSVLRPWSMVEVGFLGILVAIIKLSNLVSVTPGIGIWGTAALMAVITLIAKRDFSHLWEIEGSLQRYDPVHA